MFEKLMFSLLLTQQITSKPFQIVKYNAKYLAQKQRNYTSNFQQIQSCNKNK